MSEIKSKIFQLNTKIKLNQRILDKYFKIILEAPEITKTAKPGQFIEVKVNKAYEPLLRRPFSIHRVRAKTLEILYEVVGKGTKVLSQRRKGEYLDIIGPLGNGFKLNGQTGRRADGQKIMVAGGVGVAPLLFLAEKLMDRKSLVLIGAKSKKRFLCKNDFKKLSCDVRISTDDGSEGFKGKVADLLKEILQLTINKKRLTIYACGPEPMLKEVGEISKRYDIPAQVSLEEYMACGFGACLGCAVKTIDGYKLVCRDGPVFEAKGILW